MNITIVRHLIAQVLFIKFAGNFVTLVSKVLLVLPYPKEMGCFFTHGLYLNVNGNKIIKTYKMMMMVMVMTMICCLD